MIYNEMRLFAPWWYTDYLSRSEDLENNRIRMFCLSSQKRTNKSTFQFSKNISEISWLLFLLTTCCVLEHLSLCGRVIICKTEL